MKLYLDCIPCFQRQALQALRFIADDEELHRRVLRKVVRHLMTLRWRDPPPVLAREVHRLIRRETGVDDTYAEVKRQSNDWALQRYPALRDRVRGSEDPLRSAVNLAVAGNVIDFGPTASIDVDATIDRVFTQRYAVDDYDMFVAQLRRTRRLLYFLDNAGEIVFDRLLIETMTDVTAFEVVDVVVKGGPILNDATMTDARAVGLDRLDHVHFLATSNGDPGTGPARSSDEVAHWIAGHDLTLAKGQGNYEGLNGHTNLFFLLLVKCPAIARDLTSAVGDIVLRYQP